MLPDVYYHVYNHANGEENLFRQEEHYHYFLNLWAKYIEPITETFAYCLMPNHFHALVRVRAEAEIRSKQKLMQDLPIDMYISRTFSNFFNAYAKAYNKMYDRRGSLFNRPFKYKEVNSDHYLTAVIHYIHRNPVHHGFRKKLDDWIFTSYHAHITNKKTKIKREEVLDWFGGLESMKQAHQLEPHIEDASLFIDW